MEYEVIQQEQMKILARIYNSPRVTETRQITGILQALRECTFEDVSFLMGDAGYKLWCFGGHIDLTDPHPDLFLLPGSLAEWKPDTFNHLACDLVKLSKTNLVTSPALIRVLQQAFNTSMDATFLRTINDPASNLLHIRFVTDRSCRDVIRSKKTSQRIGFQETTSNWSAFPSDFRSYYRWTTVLESDIVKAETRKEYFSNFGLQAMAQEVQNSINKMKMEAGLLQYCGFNRITLHTASAILGRLCGYSHVPDPKGSPGQAFAFRDTFPGYDFFDPACENTMHSYLGRVEYLPRCYPLAKAHNVPKEISLLVDFLEEYPELSGHPVFDNYWVLVPALSYPSSYLDSPCYFRDREGNLCEFDRVEEAQLAFEKLLFDYRYVVGVLLGERDGEHFFICYWM